MDLNLPDIGSSGLLALVVLVTTVIGFLKGLARMVLALIALSIGGLGAYWGFMRGGSMLNGYFSDPPSWLPAAVGIILGLAFLLVTRAILGTALKPIKVVEGKRQNLGAFGALMGIGIGILAVAFGASAVRYLGTVAEIDRLDRAVGRTEINKTVPVSPLIVAKAFLDQSKLGQFHQKLDFINDPSRAQLAKLKVLAREQHAINLAAGTNRSVYDALSQPDVQKLLATTIDLEMACFREKRWGHLLDSERLRKTARLPAAEEVLVAAEIEKALGIAPKPLFPKKEKPKDEDKKTAKK